MVFKLAILGIPWVTVTLASPGRLGADTLASPIISPFDGDSAERSVSPFESIPESGASSNANEPSPSSPPSRVRGRTLPVEGASPLEAGMGDNVPPDKSATLDPGGAAPLDSGVELVRELPPDPKAPFRKFSPIRGEALDRRTTRIVRVDLLFGPAWRGTQTDTMLTTSVEVGAMHGFACSFHTSVLISVDRDFVRVVDVPIGVGVLARGRLRNKPLYGSIGLTAGILVERAADDTQVVHRVDPDFRLPIRLAWSIAGAGVSLSVIPGYSVRSRVYERRGVELWERSAYRIGVVVGMHFDVASGRAWLVDRYRRDRRGRGGNDT